MENLHTNINVYGYLVILLLFLFYAVLCIVRSVRDKKGLFFGELSSASIADVIRNMEPNEAISYVMNCQIEVLMLKSRNVCVLEVWRCKVLLRDYSYIIASLQASDRGGTVAVEYIVEPTHDKEQSEQESTSVVEQRRPSIRSIVLALKMAYDNGEFKERVGGSHNKILAKLYGFTNPRSFSCYLTEPVESLRTLRHRAACIQLYDDAIFALGIYDPQANFSETIKKLETLRSKE